MITQQIVISSIVVISASSAAMTIALDVRVSGISNAFESFVYYHLAMIFPFLATLTPLYFWVVFWSDERWKLAIGTMTYLGLALVVSRFFLSMSGSGGEAYGAGLITLIGLSVAIGAFRFWRLGNA